MQLTSRNGNRELPPFAYTPLQNAMRVTEAVRYQRRCHACIHDGSLHLRAGARAVSQCTDDPRSVHGAPCLTARIPPNGDFNASAVRTRPVGVATFAPHFSALIKRGERLMTDTFGFGDAQANLTQHAPGSATFVEAQGQAREWADRSLELSQSGDIEQANLAERRASAWLATMLDIESRLTAAAPPPAKAKPLVRKAAWKNRTGRRICCEQDQRHTSRMAAFVPLARSARARANRLRRFGLFVRASVSSH